MNGCYNNKNINNHLLEGHRKVLSCFPTVSSIVLIFFFFFKVTSQIFLKRAVPTMTI